MSIKSELQRARRERDEALRAIEKTWKEAREGIWKQFRDARARILGK